MISLINQDNDGRLYLLLARSSRSLFIFSNKCLEKRESEGLLSTARSQTCHSRRSEWVFHVHSSFLSECKNKKNI